MKGLGILKLVFLFIGIGLLTGAFFTYRSTNEFVATARKAQGKVVALAQSRSDNTYTYAPVVRFRTEQGREVEFRSSVSSSPPSHTVGEMVEVLYHPDRPEQAEINSLMSLWFMTGILGVLGSVFTLIGGAILVVSRARPPGDARLKLNGQAIRTQFESIERDASYSENGRHPYRVVTQWKNPNTGEIHQFRSEALWYDPATHIKTDNITVYIERGNPRKYFMDVSFLPKLAGRN